MNEENLDIKYELISYDCFIGSREFDLSNGRSIASDKVDSLVKKTAEVLEEDCSII